MLPVFVTVPVKVSKAPGATGVPEQICVIFKEGVVMTGQVTEAVFVTVMPQVLSPLAVNMLVLEQFAGVT